MYISRKYDRELPNLIYRQILFLDFRLIVAVSCNNSKHMAMHATLVIVIVCSPCIPSLARHPFLTGCMLVHKKGSQDCTVQFSTFPMLQ